MVDETLTTVVTLSSRTNGSTVVLKVNLNTCPAGIVNGPPGNLRMVAEELDTNNSSRTVAAKMGDRRMVADEEEEVAERGQAPNFFVLHPEGPTRDLPFGNVSII
eukprot:TRINITY_DN18334_c0_g1_i1.p2 TRINITY_DN18334_c0_g1~~TRINITY_DN18334_c0_g1_i1.p2  ORF type:complete len:105 (-),score=13.54 TRINITY_DN18334_c0_g1_i1:31-345(-)